MTIKDLFDVCDENCNESVFFFKKGSNKVICLSGQYYVESSEVYWFKDKENVTISGKDIVGTIIQEADDECWQGNEFRGYSRYGDCEIYFADCSDEEWCDKELDVNIYHINNIYVKNGTIFLEGEII